MDIQETINLMKEIQNDTIKYIEFENNVEENYENLIHLINDQKIHDNKYGFKSYLTLLSNISNNHLRTSNFFEKIEKILLNFQDDIKRHFSNHDIFNIFKDNKRVLLFLIKEQILTIDQGIVDIMLTDEYQKKEYNHYFLPEIASFINKEEIDQYSSIEEDDKFEEKRKIGENDNYICNLIKNDLIDEFISYVNKNSLYLDTEIKPSIFETNPFLINKKVKLIEYAAFFGSVQIFKYLYKNNIKMKSSLWIFATHSDNEELISILEENKVNIDKTLCLECMEESIKCFHNDVFNYLKTHFYKKSSYDLLSKCLKYMNFGLMEYSYINDSRIFYKLCKYDHCYLVENLLKEVMIDLNYTKIQNIDFLNKVSNELVEYNSIKHNLIFSVQFQKSYFNEVNNAIFK